MDFLNSLLPTIEHFRILGYWIVLLISLIDSTAFIGLISPGTVLIIGIGFLSSQGVLDIGDTVWFAAAGAIIGDIISYYAGEHVGKTFFKDKNRIFKAKYLRVGESFFHKYGSKAIFLDRFIGPVRPVATFVAGMSRMNKKTFAFWSVFSSFSWVGVFLFIGFFFGQAWGTIALWSTRAGVFLLGLLFFFAIFYALKWMVVKKGKQFFYFLHSIWKSIKVAVAENSDVKNFVAKHSSFFRFIRARFNKNKFWGLPATLLAVSFLYTFSMLGGIIEDVITSDIIVSVDTRVMNLLYLFRGADLTQFFLWVTLLGKWQVVLGFIVATIWVLWAWRKRLYIAPLLLTIAGAEIFTGISKIVFHRPRPELAVYTEHTFSFPSGHATIAVAFYGFLTYILIRHFAKWKTKVNVFFAGLLVILLIGFSRLYLGVHYVSDVWGGYLVGALWLIIGISISEWISSWKKNNIKFTPRIRIQTISGILILLSFSSYIFFGLNYNPPLKQQTIVKETSVQNVMDIFTDDQMKYTETLTGVRQEPISFIILANSDDKFVKTIEKSGWYLADSVSAYSLAKTAQAAVLKKGYLNAPMTPSFWNKQTHTFGFEKPTTENNVRQRHHARFWKTDYITNNGDKVYVGEISLDEGMKWGGLTHQISPDIDTERELLFTDLQNSGMLKSFKKEQLVKPTLGENFSGDQFFTDGKTYILTF
jgi:undecaprenyl-diphosphatase